MTEKLVPSGGRIAFYGQKREVVAVAPGDKSPPGTKYTKVVLRRVSFGLTVSMVEELESEARERKRSLTTVVRERLASRPGLGEVVATMGAMTREMERMAGQIAQLVERFASSAEPEPRQATPALPVERQEVKPGGGLTDLLSRDMIKDKPRAKLSDLVGLGPVKTDNPNQPVTQKKETVRPDLIPTQQNGHDVFDPLRPFRRLTH